MRHRCTMCRSLPSSLGSPSIEYEEAAFKLASFVVVDVFILFFYIKEKITTSSEAQLYAGIHMKSPPFPALYSAQRELVNLCTNRSFEEIGILNGQLARA